MRGSQLTTRARACICRGILQRYILSIREFLCSSSGALSRKSETVENRPVIEQPHHFLNSPDVICDSRFHRGCDPQRLMYPAEVVVKKIDRQHVLVVLQLL